MKCCQSRQKKIGFEFTKCRRGPYKEAATVNKNNNNNHNVNNHNNNNNNQSVLLCEIQVIIRSLFLFSPFKGAEFNVDCRGRI